MNTTQIHTLFESFNKLKVLIIGDIMLDMYLWGTVDRISPEAPVPVVTVKNNENRLGGAANVALNIQAMGATPIICSVIGEDEKGELLLKQLEKRNISSAGIVKSPKRITTVKTRIIGHTQQMLRVDEEINTPISATEEVVLIQIIKKNIDQGSIDVIIFQDYDKGVITTQIINEITAYAKEKKISISVDPKKRNFSTYKDVTLFKPNFKELKEGTKKEIDSYQIEELKSIILDLQKNKNIEMALVTLSDKGMLLSLLDKQYILPAHKRNIADVSGAGDTVISVASLCLAAALSPYEMASIANIAGGLVCEEVGVVPIEKTLLMKELIQVVY